MSLRRALTALTLAFLVVVQASPALGSAPTEDAVRAAVVSAARANLPDTVVDVELRTIKLTGDVDVPAGVASELRVIGRGQWLGRTRLDVEVSVGDDVLGTLQASVDIVGYVDVPVLCRSAARGSRIRESGVSLLRRPLDAVPAGVVQTAQELIGRTVRRDLRLGALVTESDLEDQVDAIKGSVVEVQLSSGALLIRMDAVLEEDSRIGAWVEVVAANGQEIRGLLVSPRIVRLTTGPTLGAAR